MASEIIDVCSLSELPPGQMRLVEWEDLEIAVINCNGTIYAIEDRCSHDNGPLVEGTLDPERCTVECPRHREVPPPGLAVRPEARQAAHAARLQTRRHLPGDRRGRHDQAGGRLTH